MSKIIIDLTRVGSAKKLKIDELFQKEAFKEICEILDRHSGSCDDIDITKCRHHNTIFIDGERGLGKTAFMLNIENYYREYGSENKKYKFLNPIDPTLLENSEKFISIVLAKIVESVSLDNNLCEEKLHEYFDSLEKLSTSLAAIKTVSNDIGIEEISSNKSSLQLEQNAHNFFKKVCELYKIDSIVILIDDIDMAFEKGFDVIEVVRKYLASPYIIPILAGDMKLYKDIIEKQFKDKMEFYSEIKNLKEFYNYNNSFELNNINNELQLKLKEKKELLDNLVEQYMRKVFPNEYRIELKSIFDILKSYEIEIILDKNKNLSYKELKDFEIKHINLGINQKEHQYKVFSNNTRDFIQYLETKKNIYLKFYEEIKNKNFDEILNMDKLKKSFVKTANFYKYSADEEKKELSLLTANDVLAYEKEDKYNLYKAFKNNIFYNIDFYIDTIEGKNICVEKKNDYYSIPKDNLKSNINDLDEFEKYILHLFIFSNYYHYKQSTKNYIFTGKFIEMIIYSLSIISNANKKNDNLKKFKSIKQIKEEILYTKIIQKKEFKTDDMISKKLLEIVNNTPFNSEFKYGLKVFDTDSESNELITEPMFISSTIDINFLNKCFILWAEEYSTKVELNSVSMYRILNKFYEHIYELKEIQFTWDNFLIFIRRIVWNFINAVAYFENSSLEFSNTSIAKTNNIDNIYDSSLAFIRNINPLLEKDSITKILLLHPIIKYILFSSNSKLKNFSLNNKKEQNQKKSKIKKDLLEELKVITKECFTELGFFRQSKKCKEKKNIYLKEFLQQIIVLFSKVINSNLKREQLKEIFNEERYKKIKNEILNEKNKIKDEEVLNLISKFEKSILDL